MNMQLLEHFLKFMDCEEPRIKMYFYFMDKFFQFLQYFCILFYEVWLIYVLLVRGKGSGCKYK